MRLLIIAFSIAALLPCTRAIAQLEPCDFNHNGAPDVSDLVYFLGFFDGIYPFPDSLPIYDPQYDCDCDGLHFTINDATALAHRLIFGSRWGQGRQWWLPADSLYIPEAQISPGGFVDVPVYVMTDHPITYVHMGLKYDPEIIQIEEFIVSDSIPGVYPLRGYSIDEYMSVIVQLAPYDEQIYYSGHLGDLRVRVSAGVPRQRETVIEFHKEPRKALYNGICSLDYVDRAPGIQLFFTHPTTVDGIIRIVDRDRLRDSDNGLPGIAMGAYPNPFNSSVEISLDLESEAQVEVAVFDLLGRQVADLYDGRFSPGKSTLIWRADDQPSGVYFCRVVSNGLGMTRRITLLR